MSSGHRSLADGGLVALIDPCQVRFDRGVGVEVASKRVIGVRDEASRLAGAAALLDELAGCWGSTMVGRPVHAGSGIPIPRSYVQRVVPREVGEERPAGTPVMSTWPGVGVAEAVHDGVAAGGVEAAAARHDLSVAALLRTGPGRMGPAPLG
jgi:hypothetical protein